MVNSNGTDSKNYKELRTCIKNYLKESDITIGELANHFDVSKTLVREVKQELRRENETNSQRKIPDKSNWFYCFKNGTYTPTCNYKFCEYYPCEEMKKTTKSIDSIDKL